MVKKVKRRRNKLKAARTYKHRVALFSPKISRRRSPQIVHYKRKKRSKK